MVAHAEIHRRDLGRFTDEIAGLFDGLLVRVLVEYVADERDDVRLLGRDLFKETAVILSEFAAMQIRNEYDAEGRGSLGRRNTILCMY